ncbi:MAG TPA: hypothetical protein VN643_01415 [Pyrinomonadaceae bacterium]|nr:hypothetical protein [Pyrinomonadaceae bacterium]
MSEYGDNDLAPLEQALDFRKFRLAMSRNAPNQQLYFIDACRSSSDRLIDSLQYAGRLPVQNGPQASAETPIYFATLAGEEAFGKKNEVSFFTNAILMGLNGMGSDDPAGEWLVTTTRLKEAIDYEVKRAFGGAKPKQVPPTDTLTTFEIHRLRNDPEVPVIVTCAPASENARAEFICERNGVEQSRRPPANETWSITLSAGSYDFRAQFSGGIVRQPKSNSINIRPIYRKVIIDI